jgi:putative restriction endonuclease
VAEHDHEIRLAAFEWLRQQAGLHGDVFSWRTLGKGFPFRGRHIPLVSPQGIFKPRQMDISLSIRTSPDGPYDDAFGPNDLLQYRYRGTDPEHPDNRGLRQAMFESKPLVYFHGLVPARYLAVWPVYIVGDDRSTLTFSVAADDQYAVTSDYGYAAEDASPRRRYVTSTVRRRLHQRGFRERVLLAYRSQCALCRLKHAKLLDAAHIIPDIEPDGVPAIRNGISMCKLHHAAFDNFVLGVTPDYEIRIREDVLEEIDGPMLQHGLKEMHGVKLSLPGRKELRPDRQLLDVRFSRFQNYG